MMRHDYHTKVLQTTLTSHESHFPVVCRLKMSRKIPKPHPKFTKSFWNLKNLEIEEKRAFYLAERDKSLFTVINSEKLDSVENECKNLESIINNSARVSLGKLQKTFLSNGGVKNLNLYQEK